MASKQHWLRLGVTGLAPVLFLWLLLAAVSPVQASGSIFCVTPPGYTGDLRGAPCDNVFSTVQAAVDAATGGEEIRVASGVYSDVHGRVGITQVVLISTSVTIRGGFTPTFDLAPDPSANPTRLTPDGVGRVVVVSPTVEFTLAGLQLTGGNIGLPGMVEGAGVLNRGVLTLTNVLIDNNSTGGFFGSGGGLYNASGATLTLDNAIVSNNMTFESSAAGIYNLGVATIRASEILSNVNAGFFGSGAGIGNGGVMTVSQSLFAFNSGSSEGAGLANTLGAVVHIEQSTFAANTGRGRGAALDNAGEMTVVNTTIGDNVVDFPAVAPCCVDGGAIANSGVLHALQITVANNRTVTDTAAAAGVYNTGVVTITNSIVAGNQKSGVPSDCGGSGNYAPLGANLTSPGTGCPAAGTVVFVAPADVFATLLSPLGDNGGRTSTFALRAGSPAIDAGDNALCPVLDQRGIPRPVGVRCDLGAFEAGGMWYWLPLVSQR